MYNPSHFDETRPEVLHSLLRTHPLATLVTLNAQGLDANHIPLYLRTEGVDRPTLVRHQMTELTSQQEGPMAGLVRDFGLGGTKP
jgi:predicted FMN-binding regulatory protein PaiB